MRTEVKRLIKQAERDLENVRKNITIEAHEVAAFLGEQGVEKYLKAYWMIAKKEASPFTHSLTDGLRRGDPSDRGSGSLSDTGRTNLCRMLTTAFRKSAV